jgi:hypothetical protein
MICAGKCGPGKRCKVRANWARLRATTSANALISALVARYHVAAIAAFRSFADSGGLMAYGFDFAEEFRLAAGYVDRILCAKPRSLRPHPVVRG